MARNSVSNRTVRTLVDNCLKYEEIFNMHIGWICGNFLFEKKNVKSKIDKIVREQKLREMGLIDAVSNLPNLICRNFVSIFFQKCESYRHLRQ